MAGGPYLLEQHEDASQAVQHVHPLSGYLGDAVRRLGARLRVDFDLSVGALRTHRHGQTKGRRRSGDFGLSVGAL